MGAIALALTSSLLWGSADFLGGLLARRVALLGVMLVSQAVGLLGAVAWVAASGDAPPALWRLALAVGGGAAGVAALTAFYRALAIGTMSIVAPISATGAVVPVVAGLAAGESPSGAQAAGIAAAVLGVVLAAQERPEDAARAADARRSVLLALAAAAGFGTFLAVIKPASAEGVPWAVLAARMSSITLLTATVAAARVPLRAALGPATLPALALVGSLDLGANALYATAVGRGLLSVVAVLGSLYPVTTVLLARALLGERIRRVQEVGVLAVVAGVALMAAG